MSGKIDSLCMGCMTFGAGGENACTHCGFQEADYNIAPHHLRPRTILNGKYLVGKALGAGGFGITYIGWDLNLELKIAIKEYYPNGFVTRDTTSTNTVSAYPGNGEAFFSKDREKFIEEARRLAKFYALPGIVSVKDFFLENETAYIVMEYVDGMTMKRALEQSGERMSEAAVLEMMRPLMGSLAEIHKAGIIHRDISPDNIMITKEGNVKLLDFGAAREFSGDPGTQTVLLKPGYAPAEQYSDGGQDQRTDIYALCATIYRAIEGKTPPDAPKRVENDTLTGFSVPVSDNTQSVLLKGLAVLRQNRCQSIPELAGALYPGFDPRLEPKPPETNTPAQKMSQAFKRLTDFIYRQRKPVLTCIGAACAFSLIYLVGSRLWGGGSVPASAPSSSESASQGFGGTGDSSSASSRVSYNPTADDSIGGGGTSVPSVLEERPEPDGPVVWKAPEFERLMRVILGRPEGDILKSELAEIEILNIISFDGNITGENLPFPPGGLPTYLEPHEERQGDITNLEDLVYFKNLKQLTFRYHKITDISPLTALTGLEELNLDLCLIRDLSPLAGLTGLKKLSLTSNDIRDITPLAGLTRLEYLNIYRNQVGDITPLMELTSLKDLDLANNRISNLSPLRGLVNLKNLDIASNQIGDISPLAGLTNLEYLSASINQIRDLSPLTGLTNIKKLRLMENQISELSPLAGLVNLEELWLMTNQIRDVSPLKDLNNLRQLFITDNPVTDLSPVAHVGNLN